MAEDRAESYRGAMEARPETSVEGGARRALARLAAILAFAACLRIADLGGTSLWYDEVVTMRLAGTAAPRALLRLLDEIDATRAPLHPLLLQGWMRLFGGSTVAARASSVLFGTAAIVLIYGIGVLAYDRETGLWAGWLSAPSPLLVYYAREVRMYAWLVLATCASWWFLFLLRRRPDGRVRAGYAACAIVLAYSHPLGLLMFGTLALAALVFRGSFGFSVRSWLLVHLAVALACAPWLPHYLDHAPESTSGRLPLRFLVGVPIGFVGGNFLALAACLVIVAFGLVAPCHDGAPQARRTGRDRVPARTLLIWMVVPPTVLYVYSFFGHPIFGPARYTLFVGPAYLLLLARGLVTLPTRARYSAALVMASLSAGMLWSTVYPRDLKADWRSAAQFLSENDPRSKLFVASAAPPNAAEVETARYYLAPGRPVSALPVPPEKLAREPAPFWVAVGVRRGDLLGFDPHRRVLGIEPERVVDFRGLRLIRYRKEEPR